MERQEHCDQIVRVSELFCAPDGDVTFKSADNVLLKFYRKNLDVCSSGFSTTGLTGESEDIVHLEETADVLELLLQLMWTDYHPDLDEQPFEMVALLAEAAEKYVVFPALNVCRRYMRDNASNHPCEAFEYGMKHGFADIVDVSAQLLIGRNLAQRQNKLSLLALRCLVLYFDHWTQVHTFALTGFATFSDDRHVYPEGRSTACAIWPFVWGTIASRLCTGVNVLTKPLDFSHSGNCSKCNTKVGEWYAAVRAKLDGIPKCSTFM